MKNNSRNLPEFAVALVQSMITAAIRSLKLEREARAKRDKLEYGMDWLSLNGDVYMHVSRKRAFILCAQWTAGDITHYGV